MQELFSILELCTTNHPQTLWNVMLYSFFLRPNRRDSCLQTMAYETTAIRDVVEIHYTFKNAGREEKET
ncbi:hypothetical protein IscW_ISCW002303 [Ixodes scapularis]|uniref:Uncharacterized protein n=1 Tax=Ixodes scapularis TaxID=6945 RepID=B7P7T7_IXOSC|nr:hypothetical protein IscW_ISCW002303 [Ixodes scapularis]|eukprot:XP_002399571.1 hypothetical protein IscW_ISCW002303 [Ixodes scapularis]